MPITAPTVKRCAPMRASVTLGDDLVGDPPESKSRGELEIVATRHFSGGCDVASMALSARNRLSGTVKSIEKDEIMAEVVVELGDGQTVTSTITRGSADRLELAEGDEVDAVVKASEVMIDSN